MLTYEQTMDLGARRYADVLEALARAGVPALFIQTGGMCAAIEAVLEGGWVLLVTDAEDTLAWYRGAHRGWGVGLYCPDSDGSPVVHRSAEDGSPQALVALIADVLAVRPGDFDRGYDL